MAEVEIVQGAQPPGAEERVVAVITGGEAYAEEGETVTAASLGLRYVTFAIPTVLNPGGVKVTSAEYASEKLILFDDEGEIENEAEADETTVQLVAYGK